MSSFLHSPAWERLQTRAGHEVKRYGEHLYVRKALPRPLGSYWQASRVNLPSDYQLPDFLSDSWFVRIEPSSEESLQNLNKNYSATPTLAVQPKQTIILDLNLKYEDIIQSMKQKHRYNIRVAQRHEVKVEIISANTVPAFDRFWKLLNQTAERHDFRTHDRTYYELMLEELEKDSMCHLIFASKDSTDLAGMLLITHEGTATYLHGASSTKQKEVMAPYLMHATAIEFAQNLSCHSYDFWGTDLEKHPDTGEWQPKPNHASSGTSRFKLGFGGEIVNYPGAYDVILKPFCYTLYKSMRALRGGKRAFA